MKTPPLLKTLHRVAAWCRLVDSWHFCQWLLFAWAACALVTMGIDKVFFLHLDYALMAIVPAAVGLVVLLGYYLLRRIDLRRVSYLIDHGMGLKNLVGTAYELRAHDDHVSRLLVARAVAAAALCRARLVYPMRLTWAGRYVAIPAVLLVGVYFVPPLDIGGRRASYEQKQAEQQQIKKGALKLKEKMAQITDESKRPESISGKEITQDMKTLANKLENLDRKQALQEIGEFESKYKKDFGDQRQFEKMTKSLSAQLDETNLTKLSKDELQNLANSLKEGDFHKAAESMRQLTKQMQSKDLTKEQKQALARELEKMMNNLPGEAPKELAKMLNQMQQGDMQDKQIAQDGQKQQGDGQKQQGDGQKQQGDGQQPGEGQQPGDQVADQMNQLAQQMEDMQNMKEMQDSLADAKRDIMGKEGQGQGQGDGLDEKSVEEYMEQQAQLGEGQGQGQGQGQGDQPGNGNGGMGGYGHGQGGKAPENKTATSFKAELDEGQINKGKILSHFFVQGVPEKGEALDEYTNAVRSAKQDATSSLARNRVPREYEEMVKNYFDEIDLEKAKGQE